MLCSACMERVCRATTSAMPSRWVGSAFWVHMSTCMGRVCRGGVNVHTYLLSLKGLPAWPLLLLLTHPPTHTRHHPAPGRCCTVVHALWLHHPHGFQGHQADPAQVKAAPSRGAAQQPAEGGMAAGGTWNCLQHWGCALMLRGRLLFGWQAQWIGMPPRVAHSIIMRSTPVLDAAYGSLRP